MFQKKYDKDSVESIVNFAKLLKNKSLTEVVTLPDKITNSKNRGDLGGLLEAHFFELAPTTSGIDFPEAGLELKTTGLLRKSDGTLKVKERLVLTMINYLKIVEETWEASTLFNKCKLILIIFYLYEKDVSVIDMKFILDPFLYKMQNHDLEVIKRDWLFIQNKIRLGKAHELSEGDTFYLGACRKGSGGPDEKLREQPNAKIGAKARAFSFKPSYVNSLLSSHLSKDVLQLNAENSIESRTFERFKPYLGKTIDEISEAVGYRKSSSNHKAYLKDLAVRILSKGEGRVPELEKAGVELKTVRLQKNGVPKESMSFPGFKFLDIVNEEWEDSAFFEKLESKFLFLVFQENGSGNFELSKVQYWNMPFEDRLEARRVWEETKRRVQEGIENFPNSSESGVAHVRPKAKDGQDKIPMPNGSMRLKQCFWLNAKYIGQVLMD